MLFIQIHHMGRGLKRRMRHSGSPLSMRPPHGPEVKGQASSRACSGRLRSIQGGVPHGATADATGRSRQGGGTLFRPLPGTLGAEIPPHLLPGLTLSEQRGFPE
jgi:hypothetical protein